MVIKKREESTNQIYFVSSSDICHVQFLASNKICKNLASAIAKFWWSLNPPKKKIYWTKWEKLYVPREERGTGFCMIHEFNLALLAKQLGRLIKFPDSLVARVLRGKYYRMSSPLRIGSMDNPSYADEYYCG